MNAAWKAWPSALSQSWISYRKWKLNLLRLRNKMGLKDIDKPARLLLLQKLHLRPMCNSVIFKRLQEVVSTINCDSLVRKVDEQGKVFTELNFSVKQFFLFSALFYDVAFDVNGNLLLSTICAVFVSTKFPRTSVACHEKSHKPIIKVGRVVLECGSNDVQY